MTYQIDTYRDGGTVCVAKSFHQEDPDHEKSFITITTEYYIDNRIGAGNRGAVYPCYPTKGDTVSPELYDDVIATLHEGVKHSVSPHQVILIGMGLEWIYKQKDFQRFPKKEIVITVTGASGFGKTTVAELLQECLTIQGFDSTHIEFEQLVGRDDHKQRRIDSVKERAAITILEKQQARRSQ